MPGRTLWKDDQDFCPVAEIAWSEDYRRAFVPAGPALPLTRMKARYEGFVSGREYMRAGAPEPRRSPEPSQRSSGRGSYKRLAVWKSDAAFCSVAQRRWSEDYRRACMPTAYQGGGVIMERMRARHQGFGAGCEYETEISAVTP